VAGKLDMDAIFRVMRGPKAYQQEKITFRMDDIRKFFPTRFQTEKFCSSYTQNWLNFQIKRDML